MWLVLAAAAVICNPPGQELSLLVLDSNGAAVRGAEVRKWSDREPREALLSVTGASGSVTTCLPPGMGRLGIYAPGFPPTPLTPQAGRIVVRLECLTGSTKDGSYRFCGDVLNRLSVRD